MSVPNQIPESNYVGNGTTTTFAANFEYASDSDVFVTVNGVTPEIGQATFANGVFTFITAPANGTAVRVYRSTPIERDTEYDNHDNVFRPRVVNIDFDRIWFVLQEYLLSLGITNARITQEIADRIQADAEMMNYILNEDNELKADYILRDENLKKYVDQTLGALLDLPDFQGIDAQFVNDSSGKSQQQINDSIVDVRSFGGIGDGTLHTLSEKFNSLTAAQAVYPFATSLNDSLDWAALQKAINTPNLYKIRLPCVTASGIYVFGNNEITVPNSKSKITLIGDGTADTGATVLSFTPNKVGFIAIKALPYAVILQDISVISTTGNDDGFQSIGLLHMREITGSTGRLTHRNVRIQGFSKHACKVGQAIAYGFDNITMSGGVETLWLGRDASINQRSTTITMTQSYLTGGKRCGLYLDRPSDFRATALIIESCGKAKQEDGVTPLYSDAAGLINQGTGQCLLLGAYFEDNYRNVWSDASIVDIGANYGPATVPDVYAYNAGSADADKGSTRIARNTITTRFIRADSFTGILDFLDKCRFGSVVSFVKGVFSNLNIGSSSDYGRVDGNKSLTINSNMPSASNVNVLGQELRFGVSNTSVSATASKWINLGHRRLDNTNTALAAYANSGSTLYEPDGTPVKIAEYNSKLGFVIVPKSSSTPEINGEMIFELTSNTSLKIKVMGSDGVVRSTSLTLS